MRILITGGSGFVGSQLADYFSAKGHKVTIYDLKKSKWLNPKQIFIQGSLFSKNLTKAIKNQDVIYNFAAISDIDEATKYPMKTAKTNIIGTLNILELIKNKKIKRFVQASSIYVNSNSGSFYRCSKKASEEFIEEYSKLYGIKYSIIRYGSIFGERSDLRNGVYKLIYSGIKNNKISYYGFKKSVRRYIHVQDVCKGSLKILDKKYENSHILLTGNKDIKVLDLMKIISERLKINKIEFRNEKISGHYVKTPFTYRSKKGRYLKLNNMMNFKKSINNLITNIFENESL
jgi:UDP-glucose 4-epimerase